MSRPRCARRARAIAQTYSGLPIRRQRRGLGQCAGMSPEISRDPAALRAGRTRWRLAACAGRRPRLVPSHLRIEAVDPGWVTTPSLENLHPRLAVAGPAEGAGDRSCAPVSLSRDETRLAAARRNEDGSRAITRVLPLREQHPAIG